MSDDAAEKEIKDWDDEKSAYMEQVLGKEHDMVMHAIIPFALGGGLDLYYYPNGGAGVGVATKEVCEVRGEGSSNNAFENYELVMFTRHAMDLDQARDKSTPFGAAHAKINSVLNAIAVYSAQATLNPNETCEFPEAMEDLGGRCLIFDAYPDTPYKKVDFGLLLILEIHRAEMDYAREHGGGVLLEKLKDAGHYPFSDLDRDPVV